MVKEVFPPSDLLGMDILRLMAAYNDLIHIMDWTRAFKGSKKEGTTRKIALSRFSLQLRLSLSLLLEAVEVIKQMKSLDEFENFRSTLSEPGKDALDYITEAIDPFEESLLQLMDRIRNKTTFHYIRKEFQDAIKEFKKKRGENVQSSFIFEGKEPNVRAYYLLADHLREAAGFGIGPDEEKDRKIAKQIFRFQVALITFLDQAMEAYGNDRGIRDAFSETPRS